MAYSLAIETIIKRVYQADKQNIVSLMHFLQDPSRIEDTLVFLSSSVRLDEDYEYLSGDPEPMTTKAVGRLISICHQLSNTFAFQLRGLIAILKLSQRKRVSYREVKTRKYELARSINELNNASHPFRLLIRLFNKTVRNAIAHVRYRPDYVEKTITFIDGSKHITIGYVAFVQMIRELSSVVLGLSNIPILMISYFCLGLKEIMQSFTES